MLRFRDSDLHFPCNVIEDTEIAVAALLEEYQSRAHPVQQTAVSAQHAGKSSDLHCHQRLQVLGLTLGDWQVQQGHGLFSHKLQNIICCS